LNKVPESIYLAR